MNPLSLWLPFRFFGTLGLYIGIGFFLATPIFWLLWEKYLKSHPISSPATSKDFLKMAILWAFRLPALPILLGMFIWLVGGPGGRAFFILRLLPWMPFLFYISPVIALLRWNTYNEDFRKQNPALLEELPISPPENSPDQPSEGFSVQDTPDSIQAN